LFAESALFDRADITVRGGDSADIPWQRPSTHLIAEAFDDAGWPRYSFCGLDDGSTMARFYAMADFRLLADESELVCHRHPAVSSDLAGLLVSGSIAAYLLTLAGHFVLHASAIELDPGRAVAFVGRSTRGKTTCAALLCAEGRPLVTDDVLVVTPSGSSPRCRRGAPALRLRPQQSQLVSRFATAPQVGSTPDGRLSVRPARSGPDELELAAIVLPSPSRAQPAVSVEPVPATEATALLLRMSRIEGWRSTERLTELFTHATRVACAVPVVEATVPWGPPFGPDLGVDLLEHLRRVVSPGQD
jgi:hypothetical protein